MRRKKRSKQKGGIFLAPFIYQNRAMTKHLKKKQYNWKRNSTSIRE